MPEPTSLKVEDLRVGTNVRVLYGHHDYIYDILPGVVVELLNFKALPTAVIAIYEEAPKHANIEFLYYNDQSENIELAPGSDHDLRADKDTVISIFERNIARSIREAEEWEHDFKLSQETLVERYRPGIDSRRKEAAELQVKLDWFKANYDKYFKEV